MKKRQQERRGIMHALFAENLGNMHPDKEIPVPMKRGDESPNRD
jgi:hypothetical protein